MSVLQPACGKPVRNPWHLRTDPRTSPETVEGVETRPSHSPCFSTLSRGSLTGPSEVLRMIRSPYSYNLSFLKRIQ
jgi:hypothetical protein